MPAAFDKCISHVIHSLVFRCGCCWVALLRRWWVSGCSISTGSLSHSCLRCLIRCGIQALDRCWIAICSPHISSVVNKALEERTALWQSFLFFDLLSRQLSFPLALSGLDQVPDVFSFNSLEWSSVFKARSSCTIHSERIEATVETGGYHVQI